MARGSRAISTSAGTVDSSQIVLKPVFELIARDRPTAVSYWAEISPDDASLFGGMTKVDFLWSTRRAPIDRKPLALGWRLSVRRHGGSARRRNLGRAAQFFEVQ